MLGLGHDQHARARMAACRETIVELAGQRATDERGGVDPFGRWVELGFDGELGRRRRVSGGRSSRPDAKRCASAPSLPKRASTSVGRQRGEIAERAQTEPAQHIDEVGAVERVERQRRQERGARTRRDDDRWCLAASAAANGPSAMPTWTEHASLQHIDRASERARSANASSPPK